MWDSRFYARRDVRLYPGKIHGQGRPRMLRNGHVYESPADKAYKETLRKLFAKDGDLSFSNWKDEVRLTISIHNPCPESYASWMDGMPDLQKPDCDNICKAIMDALTGLAYADDSQITHVHYKALPRRQSLPAYIELGVVYYVNSETKHGEVYR